MANFNNIKHEIDQNVNTNGVQAITGAILNETLKDMIDEVDDKKQDTLVAGQNITIQGNVISATGGGSEIVYTAGNGIDIDQLGGSVYSISVDASDLAGNGLQDNGNGGLEIDPSVVATQNDLSGYLPLEGGVLQQDSGVDTTLQVIDPDSEDYVKLVAPDAGDDPHIEIFENGSGDTKIYYDKIHSGNYDLNFPTLTQDETIATVSDLNTATSGLQPALTAGNGIDASDLTNNDTISVNPTDLAGYGLYVDGNNQLSVQNDVFQEILSAGDGIEIDANNEISVKAGTGLGFDANGYLINTGGGGGGTTYTAGNGIEIDQNDAINAKLGSGLQLDQNNNIEIDPSVVATQSDLSGYATQTDLQGYLPLTGGNLQASNIATEVRVKSPSDDSYVYLHAVDTGSPTIKFHRDIQNPTNGEVHEITLHEERLDIERWDQSGNTWMADTLYFPQFKTGTIALDSDLAGKQDTLTAGTGISIQNNVISATGGGGSGLWTSGTGTNSLLSPSAVASSATASGTGALNAGYYNGQSGYASFANGDYSANFGTNNKVSYANSFASGLANTTGGHEAFVGGGASNTAHGDCSAVIGGTFGTANGDSSVVIASGANGTANGSHSVAIGNATASGYGAIAIGEESSTNANHAIAIAGASATGVNSVAIGKKVGTNNENEIGLGFANKVYTSGTGSIKSAFTVGNGTFSNGNYTYSNGLELKGNSDFYVYGVGGFDGTNSYNGNNSGNRAKTLQEVLNDKQDTLTAGTGISISGNVISATGGSGNYLPLTGGNIQNDPNNSSTTLYITDPGTYYSNVVIEADTNNGSFVQINDSNGSATYKSNGIYDSGNYTLQFPWPIQQDEILATISDLNTYTSGYLPLQGGSLQQDPASYSSTQLLVESPNQYATVAIESVDLDPGNTAESLAKITLSDYDDQNNQHSVVYYSTGIGTGNYKISFPTPTQNDTFALLSDIQGGGGSGLWTSGTGTGSVMSPGATQANGNYSVSGGDGTKANGTGSVALGGNTTASGTYSTALGAGSSATNSYTVAIGHGVQAANQNETALGAFNLYTNSGTSAQKTFFTVGNGTGTNAKSNLIEAKENNDIYVVGVGNYDGTNAGATGVQTLQDAINNGGGGGSYSAGNGIDITSGTISVDTTYLDGLYVPITGGYVCDDISQPQTSFDVWSPDQMGYGYIHSYSEDSSDPDNVIPGSAEIGMMGSVPSDADETYEVYHRSNGTILVGYTTDNQGNTDSAEFAFPQKPSGQTYTIATLDDIQGGGGSYLPLTGGTLQEDPNNASRTTLLVESPSQYATAAIETVDLDPGNTSESMAKITLSDYDSSNNQHSATYYSTGIGTGNYKLSFPTLTQNDTIATLSDIQGGGSSYTAGTGISISAQNVISNSAPDPGLWVAGTGTDSIMTSTATRANNQYSISIGHLASTRGNSSVAIGESAAVNTGCSNSVAIGYSAFSGAQNSLSAGIGTQTYNQLEMGIGSYNKITDTGTSAENTRFTIGNGSSNASRSNLLEAKQNNDIYVVGVGGFDGTNAGSAGVHTLQYAIANAGGGGGSSLWTSGTGTDSLVAPATITAGLAVDPAPGTGAISCGYDTDANGDYSFSQGGASTANGDYSFAANNGTADGDYSSAFGTSGASGDRSFAAGDGSTADAAYSIALGGGNVVYDDSDPDNIIDAQYGVAIGYGARTYGRSAAAFGSAASATGNSSVGLGSNCSAEGAESLAMPYAYSVGDYSLAGGAGSTANAYGSIAIGHGAMTYDGYGDPTDPTDPNAFETALGRFNYTEDGIAFSIGCGYEDNTDPNFPQEVRENAITITNDGKIYLKGLGGYTGTSVSGCTDLVSFLNNL